MKNFFRDFDKVTNLRLINRFCEALATDQTIRPDLLDSLRNGDWKSLAFASSTYSRDQNLVDIIAERQFLALFSKNLSLNLKIDRENVAYEKFVQSEEKCLEANRKIQGWRRGFQNDSLVESVLFTAQRKIASILGSSDLVPGSFPDLDSLDFSFGPGANVNVKKNTSARWKLSKIPACSADMLSVLPDILAQLPAMSQFWAISESEDSWTVPVEVHCGELMFVAKNAKTDRSIIVEPTLNTLVQKGIGKFLKERLLKFGINLYDQHEGQTSNRRRALLASITNDLSTVDLSSASDCISTELVRDLLPPDWYSLLESCRTSRVVYKKKEQVFDLQKFSSMGNGYTFELESLIFYALSYAVCKQLGVAPDVSVYGDDIILPKECFPLLDHVFHAVGFTINTDKSYFDGPFRESCGGDYFLGQDVRPFYLKEAWSEATLYSFHNFIIRKGLHYLLPSLFAAVKDSLHSSSMIYGPDGFGDGHLIGDHPQKTFRADYGWSGYVFVTRVQKTLSITKYLLPGDYILPFYSAAVFSGGSNHFAIRGKSKRTRQIRVYTLSRN